MLVKIECHYTDTPRKYMYKPGGVPDRLCAFPELTSLKQLSGDCSMVCPYHVHSSIGTWFLSMHPYMCKIHVKYDAKNLPINGL